jgi:hypothetical protein
MPHMYFIYGPTCSLRHLADCDAILIPGSGDEEKGEGDDEGQAGGPVTLGQQGPVRPPHQSGIPDYNAIVSLERETVPALTPAPV